LKPISLRLATLADFKAVYDFINLLENLVYDAAVQRRLYEENLKNPDIVYLLAFDNEKPLGLLSMHIQNLMHHAGRIGEIQEMYVDEAARSLGIGKQLMDEMRSIAKQRNVLQLEVTSRLARTDAHRFYEREGFAFTHKKFLYKL